MSGSQLFWTSGTWLFFVGQLLVMVVVGLLYVHQGRQEKASRDTGGC